MAKGFPMGGNMQNMMRKAMEMQKKIKDDQEKISNKTYQASVGGNAVSCTYSGEKKLLSLDIADEVLEDKEMLIDMIISCVNEVIAKNVDDEKAVMGALGGGMF